jgi:diguanylate cyclase (GGDEF)-like protein
MKSNFFNFRQHKNNNQRKNERLKILDSSQILSGLKSTDRNLDRLFKNSPLLEFDCDERENSEIQETETRCSSNSKPPVAGGCDAKISSDKSNLSERDIARLSQISYTRDLIHACSDVNEIYRIFPSLLKPYFPECSGAIYITDTSRKRAERVSFWGNHALSGIEFSNNECWSLSCRGRTHYFERGGSFPMCSHVLENTLITSTICIPIMEGLKSVGLFHIATEKAEGFSYIDRYLSETIAQDLSLVTDHLHSLKTFQELSYLDHRTGLYNDIYFNESLEQEIARAKRNRYPIGLILLDIDNFKKFNDKHGHLAGNYVLLSVADLLKKITRKSDIACRYGGEEMIIVIPKTSLEDTRIKAENIREELARLTLRYDDKDLGKITASFGVACYSQHGNTIEDLVATVDKAMYEAKRNGRDRVVVAE